MPDKEGSDDDKKSTKSVVNKKQKQMMNQEEYLPEEEYDHYKDRMAMAGRDISSKDKKDATTLPQPKRKKVKGDTPMQKEFKKKYGKKATALDAVKADITAKYGKGAIMNVGKKKVKEELDLTKIAEAFGGYVVEANGKKGKDERSRSIDRFIQADDPFNPPSEEEAARRQVEKDAGEKVKKSIKGTPAAKDYKPKGKIKLGDTTKGGPVKTTYMNKADAAAAAASDALDDIAGDRKVMGRPTPSVKRGVKQAVQKPLKDRVQKQKDSLDKKIKARSTGKTRSIPRVVGASGEKPTGSIARGTYKSSPAGQDAYKLKKSDLEARQGIRDAGGTGDIGFNAPGRKEKVQKRETRATGLGTPSPEKPITPSKRAPIPKDTGSLKDVPKVKQQFKDFRQKLDDLKVDVDIEKRVANPKIAAASPVRVIGKETGDVIGKPKPKLRQTRPPSTRFDNREPFMDDDLGTRTGKTGQNTYQDKVRKPTGSKKVTPPTTPKPTKLPGNRGSRSYLKPRPSAVRVIGRETGEAAAKQAMKKTMRKSVAKGLSKQIPGVGSVIAGVEGAARLAKGDMTGAALSFGQAIPGVSIPLAAADIARDMKIASKGVKIARGAKQTARMSKNVLLPKGAKSAIVKYKAPKLKGIDPTVVGSFADKKAQFAKNVGPKVAPSVTKAMKYIQDPKNMPYVLATGGAVGKGAEMMMRRRDRGSSGGAGGDGALFKGIKGGKVGRRSAGR